MSLSHAILAVLSHEPLHGYAVRTALRELMGSFWPVNQGQVYATLDRLVRDGLVAQGEPRPCDGSGPRHFHSISERGRRALGAWLEEPGAPGPDDGLGFDDWVARLAVCEQRGATELARKTIEVQRRRCEALRRALSPALAVGSAHAARAADELLSAELRWLDVALGELAETSPTTAPHA